MDPTPGLLPWRGTTRRRNSADRRRRGGVRALLFVFVLLGVGAAGATAQDAQPAYDHPLFTGPAHEAPEPFFDQQHLRLALRFDVEARRVFGDATLRLAPLDTTRRTLVLFAAGLSIDSVLAGLPDSIQTALPFRFGSGDSLLVDLDSLARRDTLFAVRVVYSATPRRGLFFLQPTPDNPAQKRQIWTTGLPEDHRYWMPVLDAPGDKLTSEVLASVEPPLRVLSNGRLVEERADEDGRVTAHYAQDQPHALRDILLVAGEYDVYREIASATDGEPTPLAYWVYPERIGDVARTFGRTPAMTAFFAERLRAPFPWRSYAQVVLRAFPVEGAAHAGATALNDRVLLDARAALDESPDGLLARAAARQWFGGLVTARDDTDRWLDDGFATYLSALFIEHHQGPDAFARTMLGLADGYLDEARRYRRPLVWNRWDHPIRLADAHSHGKGAWVLHMLRRRLGDDLFWDVLARYVKSFTLKSVETVHFQRALEAVTGEEFEDFFATWVQGAGHPMLDVAYTYDAGEGALTVRVVQRQEGFRVPEVFRTNLAVEAHTLTESYRFAFALDTRAQRFRVALPAAPRFVVVDPDHALLAEVQVEQEARAWIGQLRYAPNPISRIQAARALTAFADDPALVIGLRSALRGEPSADVRAALVEGLGALPSSPVIERALLDAVGDEAAPVRAAALDALAPYAQAPAVGNLALQTAQNDRSYRVQAAAVRTLARSGRPDVLDVVRSALVTPSHREVIRRAAFEALALLDLPPREGLSLSLPYAAADQPGEVRAAALGYLATLAEKNRAALDRLIETLDDADGQVRRAALDGLAAVGTPRALEALRRRSDAEPDPLLRATLLHALRQADGSAE